MNLAGDTTTTVSSESETSSSDEQDRQRSLKRERSVSQLQSGPSVSHRRPRPSPAAKRRRTSGGPSGPSGRKVYAAALPYVPAYVDLLNHEIEDAAAGVVYVPGDVDVTSDADVVMDLDDGESDEKTVDGNRSQPRWAASARRPFQHGLTTWSPDELDLFFSALARCGPHDAAGIAERLRGVNGNIGSDDGEAAGSRGSGGDGTPIDKSELEVSAFLSLLRNAHAARYGRHQTNRRYHTTRSHVHRDAPPFDMADVPAAVEIGPWLERALEEVADALEVRVRKAEEEVEKERWGRDGSGGGGWRIDAESLLDDDRVGDVGEQSRPWVGLFRLANWVELQERVFMNSATHRCWNWHAVLEDNVAGVGMASVGDGGREKPNHRKKEKHEAELERPGIRTTAMRDFYALAVSLTRRLVAASLFAARSRIRARRAVVKGLANVVCVADVQAAVDAVGMGGRASRSGGVSSGKGRKIWTDYWVGVPRRVGLEVLGHQDKLEGLDDKDTDGEDENPGDGEVEDEDDEYIEDDAMDGTQEDRKGTKRKRAHTPAVFSSAYYDRIEAALGGNKRPSTPGSDSATASKDNREAGHLSSSSFSGDKQRCSTDSDGWAPGMYTEFGLSSSSPSSSPSVASAEASKSADSLDAAANREADELLLHTAGDVLGLRRAPHAARVRGSLVTALKTELEHERHVDEVVDARAAAREEARLWEMLGGAPEYFGYEGTVESKEASMTAVRRHRPSTGDRPRSGRVGRGAGVLGGDVAGLTYPDRTKWRDAL